MIRVFQLIHGYIEQDFTQFFTLDIHSRTRGHPWKLAKPNAQTRVRRNFFGVRVVNNWNSLPISVVSAQSLNQFKARLDSHWAAFFYTVPELD